MCVATKSIGESKSVKVHPPDDSTSLCYESGSMIQDQTGIWGGFPEASRVALGGLALNSSYMFPVRSYSGLNCIARFLVFK